MVLGRIPADCVFEVRPQGRSRSAGREEVVVMMLLSNFAKDGGWLKFKTCLQPPGLR